MKEINIIYRATPDCVTIYDSYEVHKWQMRRALKGIRDAEPECRVFEHRSLFSMKMEWIAHNFLYLIGYERERTKDVDLDYPCDHPEWEYIIAGLLTWLFVW